jgi:hypothetical protein
VTDHDWTREEVEGPYWWLYAMQPIKRSPRGWWKLKWRWIRRGTWNVYTDRHFSDWRELGLRFTKWHEGRYGVSIDGFSVCLDLWWISVDAWIRWGFSCSERGPVDTRDECRRGITEDGQWTERGEWEA